MKFQSPYRIACYVDESKQIHDLSEKFKKIDITSISIRGLIEHISAQPLSTGRIPSQYEIDDLVAIMEQIISFGTLGDQITEGFYDGEIGIVKAGRIGTDKTFEREVLKNVAKGKSRETVKESIERVNDEYSTNTKKASKESIDRFDKKMLVH